MTESRRASLKELQKIDFRIREVKHRISEFDPLFTEVEEPALQLEEEVRKGEERLQELRVEERRLELGADDKRDRVKRLEERLNQVRNLREEAAVHAEIDLVRRALDADEQEALQILDQIRKLETELGEKRAAHEAAVGEIEPRRDELLQEREEIRERLAELESRREEVAGAIDAGHLRLYESILAGGRRIVVAELTADGACGNCFSMIPLQVRHEIEAGAQLVRCEGCGVILFPHVFEEEREEAPEAPGPEAEAADAGPGSDEAEASDGGETAAEGTTTASDDDAEVEAGVVD